MAGVGSDVGLDVYSPPLLYMEYRVCGDLVSIYPKTYSIYVRGTIPTKSRKVAKSPRTIPCKVLNFLDTFCIVLM